MEIADEILQLREKRYDYLFKVFQNLSEAQLNLQPLENKRSIGELLSHIGMVDGFPFFLAKIVQSTYLRKIVKMSQSKKMDGTDYTWDLKRGQKRSSKYKLKVRLEKQFKKNRKKIKTLNFKEKDKKLRYFSEWHANFHLKQLKYLLKKVEIII